MRAAAQALLDDLRAAGLEVHAEGDRLRYRPSSAMTPELAERVRAVKPELLALVGRRLEESFVPAAGLVRERPLRVVVPVTAEQIDDLRGAGRGAQRLRACYACRLTRYWRRLAGGPWVCARCYEPPASLEGAIEWRDVEGGRG